MFTGFTPETIDFLWGIRMNNNREWFQAHKEQYVRTLYEPMKELGAELFQPFLDRPGNLLKVSRIYKDARLHPPVPYKESLWICIRRDGAWWEENPCLYFELRPEGAGWGLSWWKPKTLEAFRQAIAQNPEEFLELVSRAEQETGVPLTALCYKRPKPAPSPELAPYYAWRGEIGCTCHLEAGPELFDPALAHRVREFFCRMLGLYDYFNRFQD